MDIIFKIFGANKKRKKKNENLYRRFIKLTEEVGEACQAYYSVTSKNNSKNKTWDDVREELSDVIIVAMDILLTEMPDENLKNPKKELKARIEKDLLRKIEAKWPTSGNNDDDD